MKKIVLVFVLPFFTAPAICAAGPEVRAWEEPLTIPTYKLGEPEINPMFYEHESYQGAQKKIYPYALLDKITNVKQDQTYKAVYLENEYIKLCILPEIGGRLFYAIDKTNGYDFFYHQHVIKPAMIGMLGAWISGGIEWCAFHHHRNTTHMPVDYTIKENPNGSKTIWFGETERRHRARWIIGITLHPGKSYIEANVKLINRTAQPHSILYWANVAVHANDDYQVIFPPSISVATYHSKNDFVHWPIGNESYHGTDYTGVDLSWWKNHPSSISFFAWNLQEDFMGGYDHGQRAGVVHVGNHHIVCCAKLWEWAPGNIWDTKILTDSDGPYAELMVGAFSDNQPDYSWIKPYETKQFKQYWYPVRQIAGFKKANLNAAVNLELKSDGLAKIGFHTTSRFENVSVVLLNNNNKIFEQVIDMAPGEPFVKDVKVSPDTKQTDLKATLLTSSNETLISYQPKDYPYEPDLPDVVRPPAPPENIKTIEELYLTGRRMEQIHSPSVDPFDYYNEALQRDPSDTRTNTIVATNYNKRGMYALAEKHLRKAIERLTAEYTRPPDTEAFYQLGLALKAQRKIDDAYDAFYRASWDNAFGAPSYYQLATISCRKNDFPQALEQINRSLAANSLNTKAANLKAAILRKLAHLSEAQKIAADVLARDVLDFLAMNELYLAKSSAPQAKEILSDMKTKMRDDVQACLELAADYMDFGFFDEAIDVLNRPIHDEMTSADYPMLHYYLGYLYGQKGQKDEADKFYKTAAALPTDYCFPFRLESIDILNSALAHNPSDARALYYLGNCLYDIQPDEAIKMWEKVIAINDSFAIAHRNLGWAYLRTKEDPEKAIASYEKAIRHNSKDPLYYLELDVLYERGNTSPEKRLALFEKNKETIMQRKDTLIKNIALLVNVGKVDDAIGHLTNNWFYVSEGGGREIHNAYVDAYLLRGLRYMDDNKYDNALADFLSAREYPDNLGIEIPKNDSRRPQVNYCIASAYKALAQSEKAQQFFNESADQNIRRFRSEARFYQALSLKELGRQDEAGKIFDQMIESGTRRLSDERTEVDFFAKFGTQQTRRTQQASAHFTLALGLLGKGNTDEAKQHFEKAAHLNAAHTWAKYYNSKTEN
jgi:tetratricopeptide (TPR) repeat protein